MIVHLNGKLVTREQARIDPFDRGFVFGEGVYEGLRAIAWDVERALDGLREPIAIGRLAERVGVSAADIVKWFFQQSRMVTVHTVLGVREAKTVCEAVAAGASRPIANTRIVGLRQHISRMQRGLEAAGIPYDASRLGRMSAELCQANGLQDAFVYWQVTGGAPGEGDPPRSRAKGKNTKPTIFGYCAPQPPLSMDAAPPMKRAMLLRDIRWEMGWLKSTSLMGNVICAHRADEHHCDEAVFFRDGLITEGLATNVVLALPSENEPDGVELVTPSLDSAPMLAGVTRQILLKVEPRLRERPIRVEELHRATEIMFLGTITTVASAVELNGRTVGDGNPGPQARALLKTLVSAIQAGRDIEH